jgi:hypothetical protein
VTKRLALHLGHGKTGSSYLQSWLALNAAPLQTQGVVYPLAAPSGRQERRAQRGLFSMGNGFVLEECLACGDAAGVLQQMAAPLPSGATLLFSDERWMKRLVARLPELMALAEAAGFTEVTLLLFLRDPIEHACSLYLEMVKAHGYAGTLDDWLAVYDLPWHVQAFLEAVAALPAGLPCMLQVNNYSRCCEALLPVLISWLGLPVAAEHWPLPARQRVNRSLSRGELIWQRRCNCLLGSRAGAIGRALVRWRPEARPASLQPSPAALERFAERLAPVLARVNRGLEAEQQLQSPLECHG